jgi:dephospho-CoA kinase
MTSIGLTGNVASGKSHIGEIFASLGVVVRDSDKIAHMLLENEAKENVEKQFGTADRKKLGQIVFNDDAKLKELESILHPLVRKKNLEFLETNKNKICLIEIPLLFETGAEEIFDHVVYVDVSEETQKQRALQRPNFTEEKLQHILKRQHKISPKEKRQRADFIIDNNPGADVLSQIKNILAKINS